MQKTHPIEWNQWQGMSYIFGLEVWHQAPKEENLPFLQDSCQRSHHHNLNHYLMIDDTSQVVRSVMPLQGWTCKWSQCGCSRKSVAAKQLVSGWIGSESPSLLLSELQPIAWCRAMQWCSVFAVQSYAASKLICAWASSPIISCTCEHSRILHIDAALNAQKQIELHCIVHSPRKSLWR